METVIRPDKQDIDLPNRAVDLTRRYPALDRDKITEDHLRRHGIIRKGDSTLAIQFRTGKNGLAYFLFIIYARNKTDTSYNYG